MSEELNGNEEQNKDPLQNKTVIIMWGLFWLGLLTGVTALVGTIWAYVARGEDRTDIENSHFTYAIRTFWWSILWSIIAVITTFFGVGVIIFIVLGIWYIYRIIKGTMKALDKKPLE